MSISSVSRRVLLRLAAGVVVGIPAIEGRAASSEPDPLPSWNDGARKGAIIDFVRRVAQTGGTDFVPPAERIAVFDNDGTLWAEQPFYFQLAFAFDEIRRLAPQHPEWRNREPFRSVLAGDLGKVLAGGEKGVAQIVEVTHAGMSTDAFDTAVEQWLATARHPKLKRPYDQLVYQPQLELLALLREKEFKTFIVSGGGVDFMRTFAERVYAIPPERVVGSSGVVTFGYDGAGKPVLTKQPKLEFIDDGPGKPVGIHRFIGSRPILAFGNSDGDRQMLEYVAAGEGPRLALLLHHTDGEREWSYDRNSSIGKLDKALDEAMAKGWQIVDMKADWKTIFPPER